MNEAREKIDSMIKELRKEAEVLRVELQLAKMELGDEWEKIESRLMKLEAKASEIGEATADASEDVWEAAKLLGDEVRKGFKSVARHF